MVVQFTCGDGLNKLASFSLSATKKIENQIINISCLSGGRDWD